MNHEMRKAVLQIILIFFSVLTVSSQQLYRDFGNNHVTTSAISFTPDGRYMIVGGFAKLYDIALGNVDFRTIDKDTETQVDYSFKVIAAADNSTFLVVKLSRIEVWDLRSRTIMKVLKDSRLLENTVCLSPDGKDVFYLRKNGDLVFLRSPGYEEYFSRNLPGTDPLSLAVSPDGRQLVIGTEGNDILIFDKVTNELTSGSVSISEIKQVQFAPGGQSVVATSQSGRIWLGRFPSLDQLISWQAHSEGLTSVSFHPSGRYLASGGKDKMIRVWKIPEGSLISQWEAHKYPVVAVAFTPDGSKLASGSVNDVFVRGDDTRIWSFESPGFVSAESTKSAAALSVTPVPAIKPVDSADPVAQKRLALVIGNGNYINSVLANPENDAREMRNVLTQYGFDVMEFENLSQSRMKQVMDDFGEKLKDYNVGLFFYAGHGIQANGYNYLVPVDADLRSEEQVEYDCVQADRALALMEASGTTVNIIILDACRNNPFERSWTRAASGKGLAYMNAPAGTLIAYATAPGSTASDGSGKNGLYTSAILESIRIPDVTILQMFQNVRSIVSKESNKQQIPWESTSLTGDFYFYQTGKVGEK